MPVVFRDANNNPITHDFVFTPASGDPYQVPFENLLVWAPEVLAAHGITKVVTEDVPAVISDRQFFQRLANMNIITEAEALTAMEGIVPAAMLAFVSQLPPGDQFAANMILKGATQFERYHPLVPVFALAFGWTNADIDQFWRDASAL